MLTMNLQRFRIASPLPLTPSGQTISNGWDQRNRIPELASRRRPEQVQAEALNGYLVSGVTFIR